MTYGLERRNLKEEDPNERILSSDKQIRGGLFRRLRPFAQTLRRNVSARTKIFAAQLEIAS